MNLLRIRMFLNRFKPHYLIIGKYTGKPIGCICGKRGKSDVLEEEPGATFQRVRRRKCPICHSDNFKSKL